MNFTNVLRMKQQHDTCVAYLHIHIAGSVLFVFYLLGSPLSAYSPIILILVVRIISLYNENINTNASESLQTFYDHYKCVAIDQNGLRTASEYVANMRLYEPRKQPRMYTNTNECRAIAMRPLRFVTEVQRYYVILHLHVSEYLTNGLTNAIRHQFALIAA